jgi:hypothetical protein
MVRETRLSTDDLVLPLFIVPGSGVRHEITSMPGNYHLSVDQLGPEIERIMQARLPGVLLFGLPEHMDELGSEAWAETGVVQQATREIKRLAPELCVITDVCLCEYTSHGHCGQLSDSGEVLNDATLGLLTKTAVSHARAGADIIAPSDKLYTLLATNAPTNCTPPGTASLKAKICTPGSGGTVSRTFTVKAAGDSPAGVSRMQLFVDGKKVYDVWSDQLRKTVTVPSGTHRVTVRAYDKFIGYSQTTLYVHAN